MTTIRFIKNDMVKVTDLEGEYLTTLFWGDQVTVTSQSGNEIDLWLKVSVGEDKTEWQLKKGVLPASAKLEEQTDVLKVRFVDVGQGDGALVETPSGQIVIIDGGEGDPMVRYMSVLYHLSKRDTPLPVSAIVVTHGDADHYDGLKLLLDKRVGSRPALNVERLFHNGLVKVSGKPKDADAFGSTVEQRGALYCSDLVHDVTNLDPASLSPAFKAWQKSLKELKDKDCLKTIKRTSYGEESAFDFLKNEGITVRVLGPITEEVNGQPMLRVLKKPGTKSSASASHTINGHSIVLKLTYGNVRFLFGADLNEESEERLLEKANADGISLAAEVLKVPHHGSHEFNPRILEAIRAVVSIVSSGDENASKEYIHPRALLMGALGKYSRQSVAKPLVYVTEMVAFFKKVEGAYVKTGANYKPIENGYVKSQYGIVHIRTDGKRVLVITHSGKSGLKEHYAFTVDSHGEISFED